MKKIFSSILISFILFINLILPISVFAAISTIKFGAVEDTFQSSGNQRAWYFKINTTGITDGLSVSFKIEEGATVLNTGYISTKITNGIGEYFTGYILKPATVYKLTAMTPNVTASFEQKTGGVTQTIVVEQKVNPTDTYWYKDMDSAFRGVNGPLKLPGFTTSKECEDAKKTYWVGINSTDSTIPCSLITQEQVLKNFELEKIKNAKIPDNNPVLVTPKVNVIENKSIYNMLAPIGGIERMDSSGTDPTCAADPKCITNDIGKYLNIIFKLAIGICAALAVIMLIINGVKYMGDESVFGKTEAKKQMFGAIVGLLIALGAWALLNTINPALTGQGGLNISSANIEIENEPVPWSTYEQGDNKNACPSGYVDVATGAIPTSINVCSTISKNLSDLIAAAKKDGYTLSGTGSRKIATTQALRVKNNCPDPKTPSTQCKPNAVAAPGKSNHEKGLAVDFNCNGKSMQPDKINTNNVCYVWLTKNAGTYGFKNNFSALQETWHWSAGPDAGR